MYSDIKKYYDDLKQQSQHDREKAVKQSLSTGALDSSKVKVSNSVAQGGTFDNISNKAQSQAKSNTDELTYKYDLQDKNLQKQYVNSVSQYFYSNGMADMMNNQKKITGLANYALKFFG